jgi:4-nitrophenyl phosphatase
MLFGAHGGLSTLLVLTGVDKEESILVDNPVAQPDFYIDKLGSLFEIVNTTLT